MSKVGQKPIEIASSASVTVDGGCVTVKGPKGELQVQLPEGINANVNGTWVLVTRDNDSSQKKALHGLYRSLIANALIGVTQGWEKRLEVVGTGYGVSMKGEDAVLKVGFSHQVVFPKVQGVTYSVDGSNVLVITGVDRQLVGEVAHRARNIKPPDAYKGKGIRYLGEPVKLKAGKKAKTA
jgi:large subunit ribosomal protein L6